MSKKKSHKPVRVLPGYAGGLNPKLVDRVEQAAVQDRDLRGVDVQLLAELTDIIARIEYLEERMIEYLEERMTARSRGKARLAERARHPERAPK